MVSQGSADTPIAIEDEGDGFRLTSPWLKGPVRQQHEVDAACVLVAELYRAYLADHPELLCLHGGAVELGGRLVVFPSQYRAGKSLLGACFAAAGGRLFADDVLPIGREHGSEQGLAAGVAPRLRLPLPDDLGPGAQRFFDRRRGPASERYLYLELERAELAPRGARAPIGAFVLLQREAGARATLSPIGDGEVLRQVVWQNFARETDAAGILGRLHAIVGAAGCFRLRYGRAEDAVALLRESFADWEPSLNSAKGSRRQVAAEIEAALPAGSFRQRPGVAETLVDGEGFLTDPDGVAIHHLNPLAQALWRLLAEPMTVADLVELLRAAFPDADVEAIDRDVGLLIETLTRKRLLLTAGTPD